jgi:hypothetical protein
MTFGLDDSRLSRSTRCSASRTKASQDSETSTYAKCSPRLSMLVARVQVRAAALSEALASGDPDRIRRALHAYREWADSRPAGDNSVRSVVSCWASGQSGIVRFRWSGSTMCPARAPWSVVVSAVCERAVRDRLRRPAHPMFLVPRCCTE